MQALHREQAQISAYDPVATGEARKLFGDIPIQYAASLNEAVQSVDAIMLVTKWDELASLPAIINSMDAPPLLIDGRRMIDKNSVPRYEGIGLSAS